jgi:hypothetical protein
MTAHQAGALDVEALYAAVDRRRRQRRISFREACGEAGIPSSATLTRLGRGSQVSADNLVRLLLWLGETDIKPYLARVAGDDG